MPGSGTGTLGSRKLVPYWKLTLVIVPSVKYPGVCQRPPYTEPPGSGKLSV